MPEVYLMSYYNADDDLREALSFYLQVKDSSTLKKDRAECLAHMSRRDSRRYKPNTFHKDLEMKKQKTPTKWLPFAFAYETVPALTVNPQGVIETFVQVKKED